MPPTFRETATSLTDRIRNFEQFLRLQPCKVHCRVETQVNVGDTPISFALCFQRGRKDWDLVIQQPGYPDRLLRDCGLELKAVSIPLFARLLENAATRQEALIEKALDAITLFDSVFPSLSQPLDPKPRTPN